MTYYKIVRDGQAVDAGFTFLRWDARLNRLMGCDPHEAHYIQSMDGMTTYRVGWLNPLPDGAPMMEVCEAAIISEGEYSDLMAVLESGETVPEPEGDEPQPDAEPEDSTESAVEKKPMTVQEMRERIAAQDATIQMLTDCLLEMSEIVYA